MEPSKGIQETALPREKPKTLVQRLAFLKAMEVSRRFPKHFVVGADTVVVDQGIVLGKPKNRLEAFLMIKRLSGRSHVVLTGVSLVGPGGNKLTVHSEESRVSFRQLAVQEMKDYVETSEPYDKAGAYDIRGQAGHWVARLEGEYFNVMGLPVNRLLCHFNRFGLNRLGKS